VKAKQALVHDPLLSLGVLSAITALMLVTHPPVIPEFNSGISFNVEPKVNNVMEWRPHGPPPWAEADQLSHDEVEEVPVPAAASDGSAAISGGGETRRSGADLRERPKL